jgi:hypothetical protein
MLKTLIGKCEFISFPSLKIKNLEAKIDTGAFTTALHCHDISEKIVNGNKVLSFKLLDPYHAEYNNKEILFNDYELKTIKNSFGESEDRFVIKTKVKIGRKNILAKVSLTNRGSMRFPVLLGRRILKNRFIVDVSQEFLLSK